MANYVIASLSLIRSWREDNISYHEKNGSGPEFLGKNANDAPMQYIARKIRAANEKVDRIFFLATKECLEKSFTDSDGRNLSTYEYYRNHYVPECFMDLLSDDDPDNIQLIEIGEDLTAETGKRLINAVNQQGIDSEDMHIHLDYSGGERTVGFLIVLVLQLFERLGAKVDTIVYASYDYARKTGCIHDVTESFRSMLSVKEIADAASIYHLDRDHAAEEAKAQLATALKDENKNYAVRSSEQKADSVSDSDRIAARPQTSLQARDAARLQQELRRSAEKDAIEKILAQTSKGRTITDFYESIIGILVDKGILHTNGMTPQELKTVLEASSKYYCFDKAYPRSVIMFVCSLHNELQNHPWWDPVFTYRKRTDISAIENSRKKSNEPFYTAPNWAIGIGDELVKEFLETDEGKKVLVTQGPAGSRDVQVKKNARLAAIYYNYGFPFMCTGQTIDHRRYGAVMRYYRAAVEEYISRLQHLKENDYDEYQKWITSTPDEIRSRIPMMYESEYWEVLKDRFGSDEDKAKCFLIELIDLLEELRPYRNAAAHSGEKKLAQYRGEAVQAAAADDITKWYERYREYLG